ncbi:MAG: hypothetical protein LBD46_03065 [Endomicrobium sp.]|jgi:hypothetical protein|nr:hypothetical protein [Endomicrobium sp.]
MKKIFFLSILLSFFARFVSADVAITVYNNNKALIKETREIMLKEGVQTVRLKKI